MTADLLLDEMYPPLVADMLRGKGHDVRAVAASAELTGADDATVLDAAAADDRCLLTENIRDFAVLARYTTHAGLTLATHLRRNRPAAAIHDLITSGTLPRQRDTHWLGLKPEFRRGVNV